MCVRPSVSTLARQSIYSPVFNEPVGNIQAANTGQTPGNLDLKASDCWRRYLATTPTSMLPQVFGLQQWVCAGNVLPFTWLIFLCTILFRPLWCCRRSSCNVASGSCCCRSHALTRADPFIEHSPARDLTCRRSIFPTQFPKRWQQAQLEVDRHSFSVTAEDFF